MNSDICFKLDDGVVNIRVGALIVKDDKILLSTNDRDDYYYTVGGRVKLNETSYEAIIREVYEELGIKMEVDRLAIVNENFFVGTVGIKENNVVHEICFYYYMKVNEDFHIDYDNREENSLNERYEWISINDNKKVCPYFIMEEIKNPSNEIKHIVSDDR